MEVRPCSQGTGLQDWAHGNDIKLVVSRRVHDNITKCNNKKSWKKRKRNMTVNCPDSMS